MSLLDTKRLGVKVKVESFQTLSVFSRSKTYLPFIKTKSRHMHKYIILIIILTYGNILSTFSSSKKKIVAMQQHSQQFVGKERRLERKYLDIFEAEK